MIERTSSGGVPGGSLAAAASASVPASHPLGLGPNIAGLPMPLAFDFDRRGHLIPQAPPNCHC